MFTDYLKYIFRSRNLHGIHSPFVYELNDKVLNRMKPAAELKPLEEYSEMLSDAQTLLQLEELGGGSRATGKSERKVSEIYWTSSTNARMGILLGNLVKHYRAKNVLELGTCLGVGTGYIWQALASMPESKLTTIEGRESLYRYTREKFSSYFIPNRVNFIFGDFDLVLEQTLQSIGTPDLVFIDGNHRYEPTMRYFRTLLKYSSPGTILVLDDIYWSDEMKKAWAEISLHPEVSVSVDIFRWGLVFLRKEIPKQHFTLRFNGFLKAHIM